MKREAKIGYLFFLPTLFIFTVLIVYPLIDVVWLSFRNVNWFTMKNEFIGIRNFVKILSDPIFWNATKKTFVWTIFSLIGQLIIATVAALLLNTEFGSKRIFRSIFLFPWVLPTVVTALAWRCMYHEFWGHISYVLYYLGITANRINLLSLTSTSLSATIVVNIWRGFPLMMVIILAALQGIPKEIKEAAKIDGASSFKILIYIVLPMLRQIIGMLVLFRTIWIFYFFDIVWLLTRGGPSSSSETLPLLIFLKCFGSYEFGYAAALAIVMLFILTVIVIFCQILLGDEE